MLLFHRDYSTWCDREMSKIYKRAQFAMPNQQPKWSKNPQIIVHMIMLIIMSIHIWRRTISRLMEHLLKWLTTHNVMLFSLLLIIGACKKENGRICYVLCVYMMKGCYIWLLFYILNICRIFLFSYC